MIGLDTNVLVRYLTRDDPKQALRAADEIHKAVAQKTGILITSVVLCELVWVLEDAYEYERRQIASALEHILRTADFAFEDKDVLWQSLWDYQRGKGDFSDYVIGRIGQKAGCSETLTFDRDLKADRLFRVLLP